MSKQLPPAPTASALGPCTTVIQIGGRFSQYHRTIRPPTVLATRELSCCQIMFIHLSCDFEVGVLNLIVFVPNHCLFSNLVMTFLSGQALVQKA